MKLLLTAFMAIAFWSPSFAGSTEPSDVDKIIYGEGKASDRSGNVWLTKALDAFRTGKSEEALAHLQKFRANDWNSSSNKMKRTCLDLDYMITRNDLLNAVEPSQKLIDSFHEKYKVLSDFYVNNFTDPLKSKAAFAAELSSYEQLEFDHGKYLVSFGESNRALEVLRNYQAFRGKYKDVLKEKVLVPVQDVSGGISREKIPYSRHIGLRSEKTISSMIVAAAQTNHAKTQTDASKKALVDAYNSYIDQFSSDSTAGVYLNLRMRLEGKMDLDALVAFYKKCEDKDRQYHGNMLGLSNLLIDAHRPKDALLFLKQIDENRIPGRRVAERFYALARSYEMVGDKENALKYYMLVSNMTDRYRGATLKIQELTGVADFDYLQLAGFDSKGMSALDSNVDRQDENVPFEVDSRSPDIRNNVSETREKRGVSKLNEKRGRRSYLYAVSLLSSICFVVSVVLLYRRRLRRA